MRTTAYGLEIGKWRGLGSALAATPPAALVLMPLVSRREPGEWRDSAVHVLHPACGACADAARVAQDEYVGVLNLALRVRSDLSGCLSNGACSFNLWSSAMLARRD